MLLHLVHLSVLALNALTLRVLQGLSQFACANLLTTSHHSPSMLQLAISNQKLALLRASRVAAGTLAARGGTLAPCKEVGDVVLGYLVVPVA